MNYLPQQFITDALFPAVDIEPIANQSKLEGQEITEFILQVKTCCIKVFALSTRIFNKNITGVVRIFQRTAPMLRQASPRWTNSYPNMNSMTRVIPLHSLYWSIRT